MSLYIFVIIFCLYRNVCVFMYNCVCIAWTFLKKLWIFKIAYDSPFMTMLCLQCMVVLGWLIKMAEGMPCSNQSQRPESNRENPDSWEVARSKARNTLPRWKVLDAFLCIEKPVSKCSPFFSLLHWEGK